MRTQFASRVIACCVIGLCFSSLLADQSESDSEIQFGKLQDEMGKTYIKTHDFLLRNRSIKSRSYTFDKDNNKILSRETVYKSNDNCFSIVCKDCTKNTSSVTLLTAHNLFKLSIDQFGNSLLRDKENLPRNETKGTILWTNLDGNFDEIALGFVTFGRKKQNILESWLKLDKHKLALEMKRRGEIHCVLDRDHLRWEHTMAGKVIQFEKYRHGSITLLESKHMIDSRSNENIYEKCEFFDDGHPKSHLVWFTPQSNQSHEQKVKLTEIESSQKSQFNDEDFRLSNFGLPDLDLDAEKPTPRNGTHLYIFATAISLMLIALFCFLAMQYFKRRNRY